MPPVHNYIIGVVLVAFSITLISKSGAQTDDEKKPVDIQKIDTIVCDILKKPRGGFTEERKLMKGLQMYYEYLDNINDRINRGWREKENVKQLVEAVGKGPQMVYSTADGEVLKKGYEWDDDDVDTMNTTILGIKYMWDQVSKKCVTYLKDDKEET